MSSTASVRTRTCFSHWSLKTSMLSCATLLWGLAANVSAAFITCYSKSFVTRSGRFGLVFFFTRERTNRLWTVLKIQHYTLFDMQVSKTWMYFSQFTESRKQCNDKGKARIFIQAVLPVLGNWCFLIPKEFSSTFLQESYLLVGTDYQSVLLPYGLTSHLLHYSRLNRPDLQPAMKSAEWEPSFRQAVHFIPFFLLIEPCLGWKNCIQEEWYSIFSAGEQKPM